MAEVVLDGVSKSFGNTDVVHGLDLHIPDREFVVLVGPSGCGKSTTLRMIAGLETISAGSIRIGDRIVNHLPPRERNIAMVFQDYALYPHMTVAGNLGFGLKISGMPRAEIDRRIRDAAAVLGLTDLLRRKPGQLSGGQRQRVAMGRTIVREPDVYLFDEPLSNLDAKLRTQMRTEVKKLHRRVGNTIVYVTHDQVEAMTLADRIVIMKDGVIEQVGRPRDVFRAPENTFVATFIGSPPMNLINVALRRRGDTGFLVFSDGQQFSLPDRFRRSGGLEGELLFGVRPQDISPVGHGLEHEGATERLTLEVELTEDLGSEAIISARIGEQAIQATMYNPVVAEGGSRLEFELTMDNVHLFDRSSGLRVRDG